MKTLSLFTGAGGLDLGFERAGFQIAEAIEQDHTAVKTLRANRQWRIQPIAIQEYLPTRKFDALIAGTPCQGFSTLGKRDAHDPRNFLYQEVVRLALETEPRLIVIENIPTISTTFRKGHKKSFAWSIEQGLRSAGYAVSHWTIDMSFYGVPQTRKRLFFVASRDMHFTPPPMDEQQTAASTILTPPAGATSIVRLSQKRRTAHPLRELARPMNTIDGTTRWAWAIGYKGAARIGDPPRWQIEAETLTPLCLDDYRRLQTFPENWHFHGSPTAIRRQIGNAVPPIFAERLGRHLLAKMKRAPGGAP